MKPGTLDTASEDGLAGTPAPAAELPASRPATVSRLTPGSAVPAMCAVGLMVLWAAHDGGYDADTWYWGALVLVGMLAALLIGAGSRLLALPRAMKVAIVAFTLYVGWSYASIAWASSPGDALQGSNRALLYLVAFALFAVTPWTARRAGAIVISFAGGIGALSAVVLVRMATGHAGTMFNQGRLVFPTGYFNATAALFTAGALVSIALSARRELPAAVRGILAAFACGELQLALLPQSRGWLFTLPLVLLAVVLLIRDRLRTVAAAVLPTAGALATLPRLVDVYRVTLGTQHAPTALIRAAERAAGTGLLACAGVLLAATLAAAAGNRMRRPELSRVHRRLIGTALVVGVLGACGIGSNLATHGHPVRFASHQWYGFTHPGAFTTSASHFADTGTGRFDAWRVAVDAFLAHPVGGLGQDNFAEYYVRHRRTGEELQWTHSLEFRLLAHTGAVGVVLFSIFLVAALVAAIKSRRRAGVLGGSVAGIALLPLLVWLLHGSVDWFWEIPALSVPALGFLAMAGSLCTSGTPPPDPQWRRHRLMRLLLATAGLLALVSAVGVLAFPYLSVREVSKAGDLRQGDQTASLRDLSVAAELNPLSADPGRIGGTIALQNGEYAEAQRRFEQAIARDPGGWYAYLGAGLASSALGERSRARHYYEVAESTNSQQPAVQEALKRSAGANPLTPAQGLQLLVLAQ